MPKVSVCMLAYNHAQTMRRSLDNLLAQTYTDFELVISDDCSPDPDMETICRSYVDRDPRVKYFRNAKNLGRIPNYNAAISRAQGDYIAIAHDGDRYRPDLLEKWVEALDCYPSTAFVFNSLEAIEWDGSHLRYHYHDYPPLIKGLELLDEMLSRHDSPVFGMAMFRKSCLDCVGMFDERFDMIGDVDIWMRFALHYDVAYVREPLIGIVPRETNHDTSVRCWETLWQNEEMHRVNAQRRFADDPEQLRQLLSKIDALFQPLIIRQLLSCVKHRRGKVLRDGIRYVRSRPNMRLRFLLPLLAAVALVMPNQ